MGPLVPRIGTLKLIDTLSVSDPYCKEKCSPNQQQDINRPMTLSHMSKTPTRTTTSHPKVIDRQTMTSLQYLQYHQSQGHSFRHLSERNRCKPLSWPLMENDEATETGIADLMKHILSPSTEEDPLCFGPVQQQRLRRGRRRLLKYLGRAFKSTERVPLQKAIKSPPSQLSQRAF